MRAVLETQVGLSGGDNPLELMKLISFASEIVVVGYDHKAEIDKVMAELGYVAVDGATFEYRRLIADSASVREV